MNRTEILQSCKDDIRKKYNCRSWNHLCFIAGLNEIPDMDGLTGEVNDLYARKMAILFAEWVVSQYESKYVNGQPIYYRDTMEFRYTISDLYTKFLIELTDDL